MTTLLYKDPHPVHKLMAEEIGADLVKAEAGHPGKRMYAAATREYDDTVILEGGMPLIQGAFIKAFGNADTVIMLAGDETLMNQKSRLPYYSTIETAVHSQALRMVDGVISISDKMARIAESQFDIQAVVARPFILDEMSQQLNGNSPPLTDERILCVAENRPSFDQKLLVKAAGDREVILVGKGTKNIGGLGYVDLDELVRLYKTADLFVFPALAAGFGLAPFESMKAGVPAIVTSNTGAAEIIDDSLVCECTEESMRAAIDNYFEKSPEERRDLGERMRYKALRLNEEDGRKRFAEAYEEIA